MKFTTEPIVDIVVSRCKTIATTYPNHEENFVKGGGGSKRVNKLQFTIKGIVVREILSPNSTASQKRRGFDVVQNFIKRKQTLVEDMIDDVIF